MTYIRAKKVPGPRLDPGGEVDTGSKVLLYSRIGDAETSASDLTVYISYRPQGGGWTTEAATYNDAWDYWRIDWVIPGDAVPGLYDVKVDAEDPDEGSTSSTELGEFTVMN